ncbi:PhoX family protein [Nocardioides sp. GXQ0305]|uniref:PhoX family protein n=1 Tax=Nocardioides sp. GXQ0305 TaxID=3423912 RepID=UPI003D7EF8E0
MTLTPSRPTDARPLLPLTPTTRHGSRSHLTCLFRCGNACDQPVPNTSDNPEFREVAEHALARRSLLKLGAGAGLLGVTGLVSQAPLAAAAVAGTTAGTWVFTPVEPNDFDDVTVPSGFRADVVISWGDQMTAGAPPFDVDNQTPEAAEQQFGYNNDYVGVLPHPDGNSGHAVLVTNHEYTDENLMFPTGRYDAATVKRIAMASHGMSVVELRRGAATGSWVPKSPGNARLNRRLHTGSDFRLVGPAAGDDRLRTAADPTGRRVKGTLNNCAGGRTPWGTILSGEENFNQYFHASGARDARYVASYDRYGVNGVSERRWDEVDPRFDLTQEPHEPFRFGWVVEVDPYDPASTPRKQTMLGRFKHEGANVTIAESGQVVAYMGDDERFDYLYKFVSAGTYDPRKGPRARRRNMRLLTTGTLYVARFRGDGREDGKYDGSGTWIPLTSDTESFVPGMSVADVLIDTRLAADQVAPTKMDRPEDVEVNPVTGRVYCALTNNSNRDTEAETDEANPLWQSQTRPSLGAPLVTQNGNRNGYVLELEAANDNHAGRTFFWRLMLVCGDPQAPETYFAGYPKEQVSPISCPDNVAFDAVGNLWISTDGNVLGSNDGLFRVPTSGPERGHVQQFATVPYGAECCGPFISDDQRSVFLAPQHPGETSGATFENPTSTWPDREGFPRPSVVVAYEK